MTNGKPANYIGDSERNSRSKRDFYGTPKGAITPMLRLEKFQGVIWEPACGEGAIVNVLRESGYRHVVYSDIYHYGFDDTYVHDFFGWENPMITAYGGHLLETKSLITNPPFLIDHPILGKRIGVEKWIEHGYYLGIEKMAFFLKTVHLAGKKRSITLENTGFCRMYQFRKRLPMLDGSGQPSMIDYAWFIFERDFKGDPVIKWIDMDK